MSEEDEEAIEEESEEVEEEREYVETLRSFSIDSLEFMLSRVEEIEKLLKGPTTTTHREEVGEEVKVEKEKRPSKRSRRRKSK